MIGLTVEVLILIAVVFEAYISFKAYKLQKKAYKKAKHG